MELRNGAEVFSSVGEKIGHLDRVVINPVTKEVTHLVVQTGLVFSANKVIPIEWVNMEVGDRIALEKNAQELKDLPAYDPDSYVNLDKTAYPDDEQKLNASYWYPPLYYSWWVSAGSTTGRYPKPKFVKAQDVIPDETVALEEGARVISKDGKHIGNVEDVMVETDEYRATHLVIGKGFILKEQKLVPTIWISEADDDEVHLSVESEIFDRLPEYETSV